MCKICLSDLSLLRYFRVGLQKLQNLRSCWCFCRGGAKSGQVPQRKYFLSDSEWQSACPLDCLGDTDQSKPIKAYSCDDTNSSHPCQVKFDMRKSWPKKCKKVDISGFLGVKKRHTFGKSSIAPKQLAPSLRHRGHSTTIYQGTI